MNIILITALLPIVVLLIFIYHKDKYAKEPIGKLLLTFFVGCMSVVPAGLMEQMLSAYQPEHPVLGAIYDGYVVAGLSEELWKLLLLMLVIWRSRHFDEYFDGIVYATYLSLGFACVENVMYVFGSTDPMGTAFMRGLLAVPAHFLFAVTMGYYLSIAKFDPEKRPSHLLKAFLFPALLHGTYDALLMVNDALGGNTVLVSGVLTLVFIYFDVKLWRWGLRRIKRLQERTHEQNFDRQHPFDGFNWNV
jgi:RsiW-degrading membrane proteinase PrsW (M82 family)